MYINYDNEVEELCDVCGGCDKIKVCEQGQEIQACNHELFELRN